MDSNSTDRVASSKDEVSALLLSVMGDMRAFARSLTKERVMADDLVQDATVRALTSAHLYAQDTNFKAWVFTIIRNCFYNEIRQRSRLTELPENLPEGIGTGLQERSLEMCEFRRAFWQLSADHREVLTLIGPSGMSYDEVAIICKCAVGTVKSRVSRARDELRHIMQQDNLKVARRDVAALGSSMNDGSLHGSSWLQQQEKAPAARAHS